MPVDFDPPAAVVNGIPRFCDAENYTDNFGFQWNAFAETQLDREAGLASFSEDRVFASTGWERGGLKGVDLLEVGSGAGRFSRVILEKTKANLYSVDYSNAVEANQKNNGSIAPDRFHLAQASIYELPFPDNSFDMTICFGVLQHTPDFEASIRALVAKTKVGGMIYVDFYEVRNALTKLHAKYLLRPFTKRMNNERLLKAIKANADWMIAAHQGLSRIGLHALTRFIPVADITSTFPKDLSKQQLREWTILDTFDQYSPEFDQPQTMPAVRSMFEQAGCTVETLAGADAAKYGAVIRAKKIRSS